MSFLVGKGNVSKKIVKELISAASSLALLAKNLSWTVRENSGDFCYSGKWLP